MSVHVTRVLIAIAGAMGAAGIVFAALGTHAVNTGRLTTASSMLLFHAPVILTAVLLASQQLVRQWLAQVAAIGFALGAILFATDLALRDLAGHALFAMAAPSGGTVLILSWLVLAAAGLSNPAA